MLWLLSSKLSDSLAKENKKKKKTSDQIKITAAAHKFFWRPILWLHLKQNSLAEAATPHMVSRDHAI